MTLAKDLNRNQRLRRQPVAQVGECFQAKQSSNTDEFERMPQPPMHMLLGISSLFKSCLEEAAVHPSGTPQPLSAGAALQFRLHLVFGLPSLWGSAWQENARCRSCCATPHLRQSKECKFFMGGPCRFC